MRGIFEGLFCGDPAAQRMRRKGAGRPSFRAIPATAARFLILGCALLSLGSLLHSQPLSPRTANYEINVSLDTETNRLHGVETLTWQNQTEGQTVSDLQFHLYLNGPRNSQSTYMRDRNRSVSKDGNWGFIDIEKVTITLEPRHVAANESGRWGRDFPLNLQATSDAADLTPALRFISPDDGNPLDKSVAQLELPGSIQPGQSIQLEIEFSAQLPSPPIDRNGAASGFFFVAQWFPKVGVLEETGWNCHQFHSPGEFFSDFGVYDVRITLPEDFVTGATGLEVDVDRDNGLATHHYHAEDVHDFAWTASRDFEVFTGQAQDVSIRALVQRGHEAQGERHVEAARIGIEYFQDHWGDYPFPNLTVVDPHPDANRVGGMEYPTLITAGTMYGLPEGMRFLELVVIHEFGHNYWYHLLASNEFEESWMDEGINTYTEIRIMEDHFGKEASAIDLGPLRIGILDTHRLRNSARTQPDPIVRNSWQYFSGMSYSLNSYSKPGLLLKTIENVIGTETMDEVLRTYSNRWRFRHPKSGDFVAIVNEVSGQDFTPLFNQSLYTNAVLDYSVATISSVEVLDKGFDYDLDTKAEPDTAKGQGELSGDAEGDESASNKPKIYRSTVRLRRLGEMVFPVELDVRFADGEVMREQWDGVSPWTEFVYERPAELASAAVDPDNLVPLDVDLANNSRTMEPQQAYLARGLSALFFLFQVMVDLIS